MRGKRDPSEQGSSDDPDVVVQEVPADADTVLAVAMPRAATKPTRPVYSEIARLDCEIADREAIAEFLEFIARLLRDKENGGGLVLVVQKRSTKAHFPDSLETKP